MKNVILSILLLPVLLVTACAPPTAKRSRFFWPPGGEGAKIEYIDFVLADRDLLRGKENHLAEAILGIKPGKPLFTQPVAVASDGKGRVFVADAAENSVFVLDFNKGKAHSLGDLTGETFSMRAPRDLAIDDTGHIFACDGEDRTITIFGPDERLESSFSIADRTRPVGIAVDAPRRRVLVADPGTHQIATYDFAGRPVRTFGGRGAGRGKFNYPLDVAVDSDGKIYVLDSLNALVQKFDADGNFLHQFGARGTGTGAFQIPKSMAISPAGHIYVTDSLSDRFLIFDLEGKFLLDVGGRAIVEKNQVSPGGFYVPLGIAVDRNNTIWVVDSFNRMIHQFQYLDERYLAEHPILSGQAYIPPDLDPSTPLPATDGGR